MGMLKEGVRLDRVRGGRQKYRRNPDGHGFAPYPTNNSGNHGNVSLVAHASTVAHPQHAIAKPVPTHEGLFVTLD